MPDITTEEMNRYLAYLERKQEDFEKHYHLYEVMFYAFASAFLFFFYSTFDFTWLLAKVIETVGGKVL